MRIYFVHSQHHENILREEGCRILVSYPYCRDRDKMKPDIPKGFSEVLIDSGGYQLQTGVAEVYLGGYGLWLQLLLPKHPEVVAYMNLDILDDSLKTMENQFYLESEGLHPLPTWHDGEPECVVKGTPIVLSKDWNKNIENIIVGDKLAGWNETESKIEETIVTAISSRKVNTLIKLGTEDKKSLEFTPEHPLYVCGKGWTQVKDIQLGDELLKMERNDKTRLRFHLYGNFGTPEHKLSITGDKNPKKRPEVAAKAAKTFREHGHLDELIERMKIDNPSTHPEILDKIKKSLKKYYDIKNADSRLKKKIYNDETEKLRKETGKKNPRLSIYQKEHPEYYAEVRKKGHEKIALLRAQGLYDNTPKNGVNHPLSSPEKRVIESCQDLPIRFVGDGHFFVYNNGNRKNPDFKVSEQKKIIEVTSSGYRQYISDMTDEEYEKKIVEFYKKVGFKCLCIFIDKQTNKDIYEQVSKFIHNGLKITSILWETGKFEVFNVQCSPHSNYFAVPTSKSWRPRMYPAVLSHNCYLDYYCAHYPWVSIGGLMSKSKPGKQYLMKLNNWLIQSYPKTNFHLFGVGISGVTAFKQMRPYSSDFSTWSTVSRFGHAIVLDSKQIIKEIELPKEDRDRLRTDKDFQEKMTREAVRNIKYFEEEINRMEREGTAHQKILF